MTPLCRARVVCVSSGIFYFFISQGDSDCLVIILFEIHSEGKKKCDSQIEIDKDRKHFFLFSVGTTKNSFGFVAGFVEKNIYRRTCNSYFS